MEFDESHSNLFRSIIEGDLSEDQLETLKTIRKLSKKWVDNDDDSEMDIDEEEGEDAEEIGDFCHMFAQPVLGASSQPHKLALQQGECSQSSTLDTSQTIQHELTRKYITGELSFTEFTDLLDISEADEDDDDEDNSEVEKTGKASSSSQRHATESFDEEEEEKLDLAYEDDEMDKDYVPPTSRKHRRLSKRKRKRPTVSKSTKDRESDDLQGIEDEIAKQRQRRKNKRKQNQLPPDLLGLVGEANLSFARGEHEDAIKMCMEVIRLAPLAPEPFQTLGMIYEELGDMDKSLQFALISAYLSPNDAEEWSRLAEMSLERGDIKQAVTCYGKAIRCEPNNIDLMWTRCRLFEQLGDKKRMLEQMIQISKHLKPEDGEVGFQIARDIAKAMYDNNDIDHAISTMEKAFEKHSNYITSEDVNLLLELQIKQKYYSKSVQLLCDNCGVRFDPPLARSSYVSLPDGHSLHKMDVCSHLREVRSCYIPDMLPIDLVAKLVVCLIHLGGLHLLQDLMTIMLQENIEEIGDLYLDVSEAYMSVGMCKEATPLLASLVSSEKYNLAAVWLRYGECLGSLGKLEESVRAYRHVVELAPSHVSARMVLSGLLQQLGRSDEALSILKPEIDDSYTEMDPKLLLQRCNLLYSRERFEEFIEVAKLLQASHMTWGKLPCANEPVSLCVSVRRIRELVKEMKESSQTSRDRLMPNNPYAVATDHFEEIWDIYLKMCSKMFELKQYAELEALTQSSMTSTIFCHDTEKLLICDFQRLLACYYNKNYTHAYRLVKPYIFRDLNNNRVWNLFNQIISVIQDLRHNRFCLRLMFKNPDHIPLGIINGHSALIAGSYKHALGEYMSVFKTLPNDSLITFCIALIFVHMVCQKFSGKKHSLIVQGCAFLNRYLELRGEGQETYYNIGRAMHQMNLAHAAVYYYKKALKFNAAVPSTPHCDIFDLRREIAFNLSLIYLAADNADVAKMIIYKHCIV